MDEKLNETKEMTAEEVIVEPGKEIKLRLIVFITFIFLGLFFIGLTFYRVGFKDAERKLLEPQLHLSLVPSNGPVQVIPVKLTPKGIGIRFNTTVTNLIGIGLDYANKN